jgi:hypothetical protein
VRGDDVIRALDSVGKSWTRQIKAEEKHTSARSYRESMYTISRVSLKEICYDEMSDAWAKASDGGRLPTHWRQVFYVVRPICDAHPDADRPLKDTTFKNILEQYLVDYAPGWDVLRGARGVFKEPHSAQDDSGLPMSTMNVRNYLANADKPVSAELEQIRTRFPTHGAANRISAVLICEKEGFDELLEAEQIPARYDLALMSTKGISAKAARDLAYELRVPCFTLHDLDKNGFVMAAGFPLATDLGIRMSDVEEWGLEAEEQRHANPEQTYDNLIKNGATDEEAEFISGGQRVELNMFTSKELIEFIEAKLDEHGVEKVVPEAKTLAAAWKRARQAIVINKLIKWTGSDPAEASYEPDDNRQFLQEPPPDDLAAKIREAFDEDAIQSWDDVLWDIAEETE